MKYILLFLSITSLYAQPMPSLKYICDTNKHKIIFKYKKSNKEVKTDEKSNIWWLFSLMTTKEVQISKNQWKAWVEKSRVVKRVCRIDDKEYNIEIGVISGNPGNLYGKCGGWYSGWAKIKKDNKLLVLESFEKGCNDNNITTLIEYDTQKDKLITKKTMTFDEYYKMTNNE